MKCVGIVLQEGFSKMSCFTIALSVFVKKKKIAKERAEVLFFADFRVALERL